MNMTRIMLDPRLRRSKPWLDHRLLHRGRQHRVRPPVLPFLKQRQLLAHLLHLDPLLELIAHLSHAGEAECSFQMQLFVDGQGAPLRQLLPAHTLQIPPLLQRTDATFEALALMVEMAATRIVGVAHPAQIGEVESLLLDGIGVC